ncbi:MAG TPA: FtsX-like permease family protein, partial [Prolixibacteraceae bacterium]|nr:FtsX-like permease family protein [Prolixibacteraceae bacterium]
KAFSIINVLGLVIGIASFLILFIYVSNEKSFDKHFNDHQNIYRVTSVPGGIESTPWARSLGFIHSAAADFLEVEEATQFSHCPVGILKIGEQSFQQNDIMSVDEHFIQLFSVESVVGNLSEILKPNTVFISENFAKKYFRNENPIGQTIEIEALQYARDLGKYEIRGIVKNTHPKTHFNYEVLLSQKGALQERYAGLPDQKVQWVYNYVKLKKGTSPTQVSNKLLGVFDAGSLKETRGPKDYRFSLVPLDDIHLKSDYRFELKESSSKINIGLFVIISFVVLLVSLLNFINLTIARLIKRSKEMGLRKSIGATQNQLIQQILAEVFMVTIVSILLAFAFIEIIKPAINSLFEIDFNIYYSDPVVYLSIMAVLIICLGLTAVFVGFFLLGKTSTIDILSQKNNYSGSFILKSLLVVQVTIVIILMSGTFLVNKQIHFIFNKPLGFDKENVVVLQLKDFSKDPAVFANELRQQSVIASVGFTNQHFGYPAQSLALEGLGIDGSAEMVFANFDYLKTMNIELMENWISPSADTIEGMVINNHLYIRLMERHGSMEALKTFQESQPLEPDQTRINFIGVAKDFNYSSAHEAIGDFAFWLGESRNRARFIHVRLNPGNIHTGLQSINETWSEYYPGQEFSYFFMDEKIAQQYKAETILSRILFAFSTIGILISVIGISALSLFISQQRTKEIGIRKVNGAKISEILALLNKDFVKWVAIAFVIATPLAYYTMNKWLENFAYKTSLSWWIFAFAGLLALGIALLTVSFQSWKAATRNPIESLRYE